MAKYHRKPLEVEAVVFSGDNDLPAGVIRDDAGFFVLITNRPRGSFYVADGKQRAMGPAAFAAQYEAV